MAEERTINVTLDRKGLEAFVSEELAREMYNNPGRTYTIVGQVRVGKREINEDDSKRIHLPVQQFEVVPAHLQDRFDTVIRSLWNVRSHDPGQEALTLPGETLPEPEAALDAVTPEESAEESQDDPHAPEGEWDGDTEPPVGDESDERVVAFSGKSKRA